MASHDYLPVSVERRQGTALCLSGGGFRATLFHLGALRRLDELGVLAQVDTFASVSGGSILNGVLARRWPELELRGERFTNFVEVIADAVEDFCRTDLRTEVLLWDRVNPINWPRVLGRNRSVTDLLARAYAEHLDLGVPLERRESGPRFLVLAANLETGASWEFECGSKRSRMGDYVVGYASAEEETLARAVAASSAFPFVFAPLVLRSEDPTRFKGGESGFPVEFKQEIPLSDGGVYDNLGLEPVWKNCERVIASDAGAPFESRDIDRHTLGARLGRSYEVVSEQSRALRVRWLIASFLAGQMEGSYWGIGSSHESFELAESQGYSDASRLLIQRIRTDLDAFSDGEIATLENHGYSLADVACRKWLRSQVRLETPFAWPYPEFAPSQDEAGEQRIAEALADSGQRGILRDIWRSLLPA